MNNAVFDGHRFSLAYYAGDRKTGAITVVKQDSGKTEIITVDSAEGSDLDKSLKPILIGLTDVHQAVLLDPKSKELTVSDRFPVDAFPAHIYTDPYSNRDWFMNDGDKQTGNDTLNCGDRGSSVAVVENTSSADAKYLATVCVGRGHHQATFTGPSKQHPDVPARAVVSNLKDGTLSIIGNDPADAQSYLKVIATINLCEPDKEDGLAEGAVPNNSFPHGLQYSPMTGKIYNLNNGYGTVVVIDPLTNQIESRFDFKGHSNLFITPDGRYLFGRGADRKSDPNHVIAKLSVIDLSTGEIVDKADLQDVYISKYFFNKDASKLYLTTGSSGSPEQEANLKTDVVLCFDLGKLPKITLKEELRLGEVGTLAFHGKGDKTDFVFCSNAPEGSVVVLDGATDAEIARIQVTGNMSHSRIWLVE